jgi:hypothetical protein
MLDLQTLPDGAIGLDYPRDWVGQTICGVTGEDYSHAKMYLLGLTFERTLWWGGLWWRSGIRVSIGELHADLYGYPRVPFTAEQVKGMLRYWLRELDARTPYNVPKLFGMYLAVKLGWRVPFQAWALGDICSPTVDKAVKAGGLDMLPGRGEQATTPGGLALSPLYTWYARG